MKRSINRWTMSLATAGVLALPVTSFATTSQEQAPQQQQQPQQQPQPAQPQPAQPQPEQPPAQPPAQPQPDRPQQPPTQPQPTTPQPTEPQTPQPTTSAAQSTPDQTVSPQEHLRQAEAAVKDISANSVPSKNRSDLNKLKQHLSNLEKMGSSPTASAAEPARPEAGKSASSSKANWGTEVAAIDKIISEMVGSETSSTATSTPGATGTSGATKSSTAIDDATRAKLMDVRTHITAYAAGMAGTSSTPKTEASNTAASPAAAATEPSAASASPASASPASASPASSQQPSATPSSPQNPAAGAQNPPSTQPDPNAPAQQPPAAGQQPAAEGQASTAGQPMNADEAHRHLVSARDTLSQLTQLPAAGQLSGEARTQVAQLISNFNELIGNPPDWHVSYQKVSANLTTLLGPENSDAEAQGGAPTTAATATPTPAPTATPGATPAPGATATPGAVGTAGTASIELDPSIRAKLVEFRRSLNQFEKAAGK